MVTLLCGIWSVVGCITVAVLAAMTIHNDRKEYARQQMLLAAVRELNRALDSFDEALTHIIKEETNND